MRNKLALRRGDTLAWISVNLNKSKLAYSLPEAAEVASVGLSTLKTATDRGELPKRYPSGRPIILATDLRKWLESLPTESPRENGSRR